MHIISTAISPERLPQFIRQVLQPCLPYSLPLLRRCQYHAKQPIASAEVWFVSATDWLEDEAHLHNADYLSALANGHRWLAAHLDLSNAGQTQVWTFASWEATYCALPDPESAVRTSKEFSIYERLFDALCGHLQKQHIPKLPREPPEQWQRLKTSGKIVSLPFSRSKVLFGTLAECNWLFLENRGPPDGYKGVSREDKGYLKYIITSESSSFELKHTPDTLHFAPMKEEHLQTILDRTNIPRTIETLRQLHNIGLFDSKNVPVAWGLLGKDASISSLHTEPEYRRQGLAEAVSRKLLADQNKLFIDNTYELTPNDVVYAHADVSSTNLASRKVMEKLGGKVMWSVAWIEVELGENL